MKKVIALLLAVLMLMGMVACASKTAETPKEDTTEAQTPAEPAEKTEEPAKADGDGFKVAISLAEYNEWKRKQEEEERKLAEQYGMPYKENDSIK